MARPLWKEALFGNSTGTARSVGAFGLGRTDAGGFTSDSFSWSSLDEEDSDEDEVSDTDEVSSTGSKLFDDGT